MFTSVKSIHFVGIGGIGMSAIAEILLSQGFSISGSDLARSENTDFLEKLGARIFIGHNESNIANAEVVVYSSAVKPNENPETVAAYKKNIPVLRRAEMLSEVSRLSYTVAIAGTHGKTTTTSMVGLSMIKAGFDPTVIVGGRLRGLGGSNARLGKGEWTVVEADEYDRSFLQLLPTIAVINNVEAEHMDVYSDFNDLKNTFLEFANKVPFYGFVAVGLDDKGVKEILSGLSRKVFTFGLSPHCDIRAENIKFENRSSHFDVFEYGEKLGSMTLNIPGFHNVKNALAAVTVARRLGADFCDIKDAISEFTGVFRRFEIKGEIGNTIIIDDYAHHPTEIQATLQAARDGWKRRIVCIFQPHTYTRTQRFFKDFGRSFDNADVLVVTDIYPAREKPIEGIDGKLIADSATQYGHRNVHYLPDKESLYEKVNSIIKDGDIVITMGAGDIWKLSEKFILPNNNIIS